jgi:hypothetical protein
MARLYTFFRFILFKYINLIDNNIFAFFLNIFGLIIFVIFPTRQHSVEHRLRQQVTLLTGATNKHASQLLVEPSAAASAAHLGHQLG